MDWLRITRNGGLYVTNRRGRSYSLFSFYFQLYQIYHKDVSENEHTILAPQCVYRIDLSRRCRISCNRNYTMLGFALLNEFYEFLGLEQTDYGNEVRWVIEDDSSYWVDFNHRKITIDDSLECYVIEMLFEPTMDWKEHYY